VQRLLGIEPDKHWCRIAREYDRSSPTSFLTGRGSVGDITVVEFDGRVYLGEIVEIRTSTCGYESYRLKFIDADDKPMGLDEDWIVKRMNTLLKKDEVVAQMRASDPWINDQSPELLEKTYREAAIVMWRQGLRIAVQRQVDERRKQGKHSAKP